jgi:hypothetical protein
MAEREGGGTENEDNQNKWDNIEYFSCGDAPDYDGRVPHHSFNFRVTTMPG